MDFGQKLYIFVVYIFISSNTLYIMSFIFIYFFLCFFFVFRKNTRCFILEIYQLKCSLTEQFLLIVFLELK